MGRRKGSLNKSTIERLKLEAKLKEEKENKINENTSSNLEQLENTVLEQSPSSLTIHEMPLKKNKEKYNICERCGETVYCDPVKIDLNFVLGLSEYHRESKRYVKICMKCAKELNSIIDNWLCESEKGGNPELRRFPKF